MAVAGAGLCWEFLSRRLGCREETGDVFPTVRIDGVMMLMNGERGSMHLTSAVGERSTASPSHPCFLGLTGEGDAEMRTSLHGWGGEKCIWVAGSMWNRFSLPKRTEHFLCVIHYVSGEEMIKPAKVTI